MRNYTQTIEFSFKTVISLITVCVLLSILIPFNQVEASDCPLLFKPDRIIINFGDNRLRSDQGEDKSIHGPINASVPAGIYDIKLVSYDDHSNHSDPAQTKEYYYVALKDSSGSLIANTPTIADLPDNLDYMNLKVATNFSIPRNVSSVTAIHPAYWDPSPNSIEAVCMAFDRVQLDPVLSIHKSVNRTTANVGDIITYALNYQNTGNGSATNVVIRDPFVNLNQSYLTFIDSNPS
ncbi:DUF11 domain-containing protein, partial [Patescibacteria group bacterium]|nr:DUF11 domain-containing protein [Patescibacteria group bacterium]